MFSLFGKKKFDWVVSQSYVFLVCPGLLVHLFNFIPKKLNEPSFVYSDKSRKSKSCINQDHWSRPPYRHKLPMIVIKVLHNICLYEVLQSSEEVTLFIC